MATSKVLKPRRGSTAEHATFKGQAFEITFDTDKKTVVAHDGLTMGGFPLAHEAALSAADNALRTLIDQKVSEVEGVSSNELKALEGALRGLINSNAQQQNMRDDNQDNVISALDATLRALIAQEVEKAISAASAAQFAAADAHDSATSAHDRLDVNSSRIDGLWDAKVDKDSPKDLAGNDLATLPNWGAVVAQSVNVEYTASCDGLIFFGTDDYGGAVGQVMTSNLRINGVSFTVFAHTGLGSSVFQSGCVQVSKGDKYAFFPGRLTGSEYLRFIPLKGAN